MGPREPTRQQIIGWLGAAAEQAEHAEIYHAAVRGAKVRADGQRCGPDHHAAHPSRRSRASGNPRPQPLFWIPALRSASAGITKKSDCCTCVPGLLPPLPPRR
jgi:hypothetical protein